MGKVMLSILPVFILLGAGCSWTLGETKAQQLDQTGNSFPAAQAAPERAESFQAEPSSAKQVEPRNPKPQLVSERRFLESVASIEREDPALRRLVGYSTPGTPLRLPAKVIQIYVAPYTTPLGRLVGEHFVYAVVQPESWWTPGSIGFDAIPPPDVLSDSAFGQKTGQGEDRWRD